MSLPSPSNNRTNPVRKLPLSPSFSIYSRRERRSTFITVSLIALAGLSYDRAHGYDPLGPPSDEEIAFFERLWSGFTLYKSDQNPVLQELKLRGRYQGQYHDVSADGEDVGGWEDRRSRFGIDARLFEGKLELRADFGSNDGFRDIYNGLVDAYLRWKPDDWISITAGKMKPFIGAYDWLPSTNNQRTFERSQIFNQLNIDRATGIAAEVELGTFTWQLGLYSNAIDRDPNSFEDAFGNFDGSWSLAVGLGWDLSTIVGSKKADLWLHWLHSDLDADSNVLARYEDIVSGTFWWQDGAWGVITEGYYAAGGFGADDDVVGGFILGTYDLVPKRLQLVSRYSFAFGEGMASVRGQRRYEGEIVNARGDSYHAFYLGAQYFIYGDRLKLMAGAEYASLDGGPDADDYKGLTFFTGLRFYF